MDPNTPLGNLFFHTDVFPDWQHLRDRLEVPDHVPSRLGCHECSASSGDEDVAPSLRGHHNKATTVRADAFRAYCELETKRVLVYRMLDLLRSLDIFLQWSTVSCYITSGLGIQVAQLIGQGTTEALNKDARDLLGITAETHPTGASVCLGPSLIPRYECVLNVVPSLTPVCLSFCQAPVIPMRDLGWCSFGRGLHRGVDSLSVRRRTGDRLPQQPASRPENRLAWVYDVAMSLAYTRRAYSLCCQLDLSIADSSCRRCPLSFAAVRITQLAKLTINHFIELTAGVFKLLDTAVSVLSSSCLSCTMLRV